MLIVSRVIKWLQLIPSMWTDIHTDIEIKNNFAFPYEITNVNQKWKWILSRLFLVQWETRHFRDTKVMSKLFFYIYICYISTSFGICRRFEKFFGVQRKKLSVARSILC
jgi:hypothetical protein